MIGAIVTSAILASSSVSAAAVDRGTTEHYLLGSMNAVDTEQGGSGNYLRLVGAVVFPEDVDLLGVDIPFDTGFGGFFSAGYLHAPSESMFGYALESEVGLRGYDTEFGGGSILLSTVTLNGLLFVQPNAPITPYVGGGAGVSFGYYSEPGFSDNDITLNLQGIAGFLMGSDRVKFDVGVRYIFAPHELQGFDVDVANIAVHAGIFFSLGE